jgi:O-antigen/teichoic acid export membrane protein
MELRAHSAGLMSRVLISIGAIQLLIMFVALVRAKVLSVLLGPSGFGVVSTIDQATLTAMQLAHLSLPFTALKFMSRRHGEGHDAFERTYASFFRALLGVALLAVLVLEALLWWRPAVFGAELVEYRRYFAIAFLGIPSLMLNVLLINALAAAQRGAAGALTNLVVGAVATVAAIVGVTLGGFGGLYVASVVSGLAATAGVVWYLRRSMQLSITSPGARLRDELRESPEIVSYSLYVYVAVGAYLVAVLVTRFFVFDALGAAAAGLLQALLSIALTVGAVMTPMSGLYLVPLLNRQMPVPAKLDVANDFAAKIALFFLLGGVAVSIFPGLALTVLFSSEFAGAASVLFLFVVWQCLHHLVNVYLQLLIGLDDVRFYALLNCVAYAGAALAFRPLIDAYGLGGAAIALSVASVINAIGAASRLAARFHARIGSVALVRGVASVAAIIGAGALFRGSPELSTSGIALRVAYLVAVSLLLWMTMSAAERDRLRSWRIASAP